MYIRLYFSSSALRNIHVNGILQSIRYSFFLCVCTTLNAQNTGSSFALNGIHHVEYFQTNYRIPQLGISNLFCRAAGNSSITTYDIPFQLDYFMTTEPQTIYKTNYFKFKFDKDAYLLKLNQNKKLKENELKKQIERIQKERATLNLKLALDSIKNKSSDIEYQANCNNINSKLKQLDSLKKTNGLSNRVEIDNLTTDLKNLRKDSLLFLYQKLENYNQLKENKLRLMELDSAFDIDTSSYRKFLDYGFHSNEKINSMNVLDNDHNLFNKWLPMFHKIKNIDIGLVNPIFCTNSFNGNSLRGIHLGFKLKNFEYEIVTGKIQSFNLKSFSRFSTDFNSWAYGLKTSFVLKTIDMSVFAHVINLNANNYNQVVGFFSKVKPRNQFETSIGFANCLDVLAPKPFFSQELSGVKNWLLNKSMEIYFAKSIGQKSKVELISKSVGLLFRNYGNPFMTKGLIQHEIKFKTNLFKKNINSAIFFKNVEYIQINEEAYPMISRGLGFSVRSQYKHPIIPNFTLSYTPFEQGNNHPDSMFRIFTKTAVLTTSLFKNHTLGKQNNIMYQCTYFKNQTSINSFQKFNNENINFSVQFQSSKGNMFNFTIIKSTTEPKIDSLESLTAVGSLLIGNAKAKGSFNVLKTNYLNGGERTSINSNFQFQLSSLQYFSINLSYEYINKIWGLNSKYIYSFHIKYLYKLTFSKSNLNK